MSRTWPAPAKINLFLHVTGKRRDGYHELQTVFRFLDHGDTMEISVREDGRIERDNDVAAVPAQADLTLRAARCLQEHTGTKLGATIHLDKRLPVGGGLGGGSSDAATTLLALNQLWELELDRETLLSLAAELGADVPVFVYGYSAWAEGIGERLNRIELAPSWYVVLVPPIQVSTARIFAGLKLTPENRPITIRDFLAGGGRNDLEPVVCKLYPDVNATLNWLRRYGDGRMTGSGASVFLPVADRAKAEAILAARPAQWVGFAARGLDVHPLMNS